MAHPHGPNLLYREVALRNLCCEAQVAARAQAARIEGLSRLRRGQNESRADARSEIEGN
jgi:hypothetical protein